MDTTRSTGDIKQDFWVTLRLLNVVDKSYCHAHFIDALEKAEGANDSIIILRTSVEQIQKMRILGKVTFDKGKWSGTFGLRYEDSESEGYSVTLDSTLTRNISRFFPSASLSRDITKVIGATVAYSYRIDRPRYSNLNPFVYYLDPFTY